MTTCSLDGCEKPRHGKLYCQGHYKRWRLYGDPLVRKNREGGTGGFDLDGYIKHHVGEKFVYQHVSIAEKVLGKTMPSGAKVHHADGDRGNNVNSNLVICPSQAYHMLLHKRMRALEITGHADWNKCWICKEWGPPDSIRSIKTKSYHLKCRADYARARGLIEKAKAAKEVAA